MLTQIDKHYTKITLDVAPPGARLTLSNPPVNIIDLRMMDELLDAVEHLGERTDISFFIIAGSSRAWTSPRTTPIRCAQC